MRVDRSKLRGLEEMGGEQGSALEIYEEPDQKQRGEEQTKSETMEQEQPSEHDMDGTDAPPNIFLFCF